MRSMSEPPTWATTRVARRRLRPVMVRPPSRIASITLRREARRAGTMPTIKPVIRTAPKA